MHRPQIVGCLTLLLQTCNLLTSEVPRLLVEALVLSAVDGEVLPAGFWVVGNIVSIMVQLV